MQRAVQVPSALIDTLLGLVVLFVVGSQMWSRKCGPAPAALAGQPLRQRGGHRVTTAPSATAEVQA